MKDKILCTLTLAAVLLLASCANAPAATTAATEAATTVGTTAAVSAAEAEPAETTEAATESTTEETAAATTAATEAAAPEENADDNFILTVYRDMKADNFADMKAPDVTLSGEEYTGGYPEYLRLTCDTDGVTLTLQRVEYDFDTDTYSVTDDEIATAVTSKDSMYEIVGTLAETIATMRVIAQKGDCQAMFYLHYDGSGEVESFTVDSRDYEPESAELSQE